MENVDEMVGTREAETVATESGGTATTGDETVATAGDATVANGGVMYADEGPYIIEVCHVEEMVGMIEKRRMATESGGEETATRPGVPGTRPETRRRRRLVTKIFKSFLV